MKPTITFVLAGGTIDKEYDALDKAFTIGRGAVERVLGYVRPNFNVEVLPVAQKVSTDITEQDKKRIKKSLRGCKK